MFLRDLIAQARSVLPLFDSTFTDNSPITSVTKSGDDVTVTSVAHGLSVSDQVLISGVKTEVTITDITTVDGIATVTTATDHDLTFGFTLTAQIISPEPLYDGVFTILSVPNHTTFNFAVTGTPAPSTGTLLTFHNIGFNGVQTVSAVVDTDNFEYILENDNLTNGAGPNMLLMKAPRISGAGTILRAINSYTKLQSPKIWGIFVFQGMTTSDDETIKNDSKNERTQFEDFKLRLINDFTFYVFIPTKDEMSGRSAIDTAQALAKPIYKTLAGYIVENGFTTNQQTIVMPSGHGIEEYEAPFLIYGFDFQVTEFLLNKGCVSDSNEFMDNTGDILPDMNTVSFRRFNSNFENEFQENIKDDEFDIGQ